MKKSQGRMLAILLATLMVIVSIPFVWGSGKVQAAPYPENSSFAFLTYKYNSNKQVGSLSDYTVDKGDVFVPNNATGEIPVIIFVHGAGGTIAQTYADEAAVWIKKGYLAPFAIIAPDLGNIGFDSYVYAAHTKSNGDNRKFLGEVISRIKNGDYDQLNKTKLDIDVTFKKTNLTLCGYSMGGGVSILGGAVHYQDIVNIGSFSQCPQTLYEDNSYESWLEKYADLTKDSSGKYHFNQSSNRHMFMAYSKAEGSDCQKSVTYCYGQFGKDNDFAVVAFDTGIHTTTTFFKEFFCYMFYLQNERMPNDDEMMAALRLSSAPTKTVTLPDKPVITPELGSITGTVSFNPGTFVYQYNVKAVVTDCNCAEADLAYQWYRGNTLISGATSKYYTIEAEDIDKKLTCVITDKTGTLMDSIQATSPTVQKGYGSDKPTGISVTPCTPGKSNGRLGHVTTAMEYATSSDFKDAKPCPGVEVTGLKAGTYYVRYAETETTKPSYACEKVIPESLSDVNLLITNKSLLLQDTIAIDFMVAKSGLGSEYHDPYITITQGERSITLSNYKDDGTRLTFTYPVAPQLIGEDATIALYATSSNGKLTAGEIQTYSVAQYCYNMLGNAKYEGSQYATFRRLLVDILYYGDAAQQYVNYRTDELASKRLTKAQRAMGTDVTVPMTYNTVKLKDFATVSEQDKQASLEKVSLYLVGTVNVQFRFTANSLNGLHLVVTGNSDGTDLIDDCVNFSDQKDDYGYYLVNVKKLNAAQMRKTIYATLWNGNKKVSNTYRYSIESYAQSMQSSDSTTLKNLLAAMMRYGKSAEDYVAGQ